MKHERIIGSRPTSPNVLIAKTKQPKMCDQKKKKQPKMMLDCIDYKTKQIQFVYL